MAQHITRSLTVVMAIAAGLSVANIYYNQPVLGLIIANFADSGSIRLTSALTQLGYALGLLLLVPLGDSLDRRRVILTQCVLLVAALTAAATAPSAFVLLAASIVIGAMATIAQQIVPFAAELAPPEHRGRTVGLVMSGLLAGILLARALSGVIGENFGWRATFWVGAALVLVMTAMLVVALPRRPAAQNHAYGDLLLSLIRLARQQPALRRAILIQGGLFGCFNIFWTTLALLLQGSAYRLGADIAGLFGIIGVTGVFIAPWAGRKADQQGPDGVIRTGIWLVLASFAVFAFVPSLAGLAIGVVLLDTGVQMAMISNQSVIFALVPSARNRINTIYMTGMFLAGALGSAIAGSAWTSFGWPAVCTLGVLFALGSLAAHKLMKA